jgi:hypothetical protein
MTPERKAEVDGHVVEEYWWGGRFVVYIDNHLTKESFTEAYDRLAREEYQRDNSKGD